MCHSDQQGFPGPGSVYYERVREVAEEMMRDFIGRGLTRQQAEMAICMTFIACLCRVFPEFEVLSKFVRGLGLIVQSMEGIEK